MLQEIKSQFPAWCSDNTTPFSLTLSDDLDSLLSCYLLEQIKGYPIHYFYDFKNLSKIENANRQSIGIDIDLVNGKCWGNHLTFQSLGDIFNIKCANLNTVCKITKSNYFDKYAGSTLLEIISYYNIPLPLSEEQLMFLLSVDSSYIGYYSGFRASNIKWLKILELEPLIEILQKHTIDDFKSIQNKYQMNKKIYLVDGYLKSDLPLKQISNLLGIDLKLPEDKFKVGWQFKPESKEVYKPIDKSNLVSFAMIYRNKAKFTKKIFNRI